MSEKTTPKETHPKLQRGEPARLFPVLADTNKENRMASIFLAILPLVPELSSRLFESVGFRLGKRANIKTFTEISLKSEGPPTKKAPADRPDGLISVTAGSKTWEALIEAKIGNNNLDQAQVERYLELAKTQGIPALITISNEFVTLASHSPLNIKKTLTKKVELFHWSWMFIRTECEKLLSQKTLESPEQVYVLQQFLQLLEDKGTGIVRYTQMPAGWEEVVNMLTTKQAIPKSNEMVSAVVKGWLQELKDSALMLSRDVGQTVTMKVERAHVDDVSKREKDFIALLCDTGTLTGSFKVPDAAADIEVCIDLAGKTVTAWMQLKAPTDKASNSARVNWLLRMLKKDDGRMFVRANWPGRRPSTEKQVLELRENPKAFDESANGAVAHSFDVIMRVNASKRFGRKVIIEVFEELLTDYYALVGQNLRAWQPPPPKPKTKAKAEVDDSDDNTPESEQEDNDS